MATKINYRNIPRFLLLLLGAFMLSLIMQERLQLSRPMGESLLSVNTAACARCTAAAANLANQPCAADATAIPCALWVVNQLNNNLDIIYALIVIVIIGVLHVQLGDGGVLLPVYSLWLPHNALPNDWCGASCMTNMHFAWLQAARRCLKLWTQALRIWSTQQLTATRRPQLQVSVRLPR